MARPKKDKTQPAPLNAQERIALVQMETFGLSEVYAAGPSDFYIFQEAAKVKAGEGNKVIKYELSALKNRI
jgi:hypothetical protein